MPVVHPFTNPIIHTYVGRGTHGAHVARGQGTSQLDIVSLDPGANFGGDFHRDQFWVVLSGAGTLSHGEKGPLKPFQTGHMEHCPANDRHLVHAAIATTLLIIESDRWSGFGPWIEPKFDDSLQTAG